MANRWQRTRPHRFSVDRLCPAARLSLVRLRIDFDCGGRCERDWTDIILESSFVRRGTNGRPVSLGTNTIGSLGLTAVELDWLMTPNLKIGSATTGSISVSSDITRSSSTNLQLQSNGAIILDPGAINTSGGTVAIDSGTGGLQPIASGYDFASGAISFASGDTVSISVNGPTVDTDYGQLRVTGSLNLTGVSLTITDAYPTNPGQPSFTIVSADGGITGTFVSHPAGANVVIGSYAYKVQYTANTVELVPNQSPIIVPIDEVGEVTEDASTPNLVDTGSVSFTDADPLDAITSSIALTSTSTAYRRFQARCRRL